jgi:hypothetical protein
MFDQDYSELMTIFHHFIHGTKDTVIGTANGNIMSLAGIQEMLRKSNYMQKVFDYATKTKADQDALAGTLLEEGNLVRVFKDPNEYLNGLYEVLEDGTLRKIDYVDLTNIVQSRRLKKYSQADVGDPDKTLVARLVFPKTETRSLVNLLTGRISMFSRVLGKTGACTLNYRLTYMTDSLAINQQFYPHDTSVMAVDTAFNAASATMPKLKAYWEEVGLNMVLTIRIEIEGTPPFQDTDLVRYEVTIEGVDGHNLL